MAPASLQENQVALEVKCAHCGLPSPAAISGELSFCCEGCRGAYHLIRSWGFDDYYALRGQLTSEAAESVEKVGRYDELDNFEALGLSRPRPLANGLLTCRVGVSGLHCAACSWLIEKAATTQSGWQSARVRMNDNTIDLIFDPQQLRLSQIGQLLGRLGYRIAPLHESDQDERASLENREYLIKIAIAGFCAANAMWIAVALYAGEFNSMAAEHQRLLHFAGVALSLVSVAVPGRTFFRGAFASLRTRTPHMDLPIALGIGVGAISGVVSAILGHGENYFDSVAMLVFFLLIGRWIQFRQQRKAAESVAMLMRLTPRLANKLDAAGRVQRMLADLLKVDDLIRVDAGEVFPADAMVVRGESQIDRSLMTGESRPVDVALGDTIEAGNCNLAASLDLRVVATGKDTRIGKIATLIEDAAIQRAPIVQLADAIGNRFVVRVVLIALVTFIAWAFISWSEAIEHATALLIVACPCALALATPLAIAMAIGRSAKRGILIRGADALERVNKPGVVWFDKTGTLTTGKLQFSDWSGDDATLALAAAIESHSKHPVAQSVLVAAQATGIPVPVATDVTQVSGLGVQGTVEWKRIVIGSENFIRGQGVLISDVFAKQLQEIYDRGASPLLVVVDGQLAGIASLSDRLRPDAKDVVRELKQRGWRVGVLSGDHPQSVQAVAQELSLDEELVCGGISPEQKLDQIRRSKSDQQTVLMVGDGVNDAAALAAADVGVAIRGGAAASLEAAPVYLASGKLQQLAEFVDACGRTVRTIRLSFATSLGYNILAITLAAFGIITPLIAAILMPISSLTVLAIVVAAKTYR